jgi:hypothetical protein
MLLMFDEMGDERQRFVHAEWLGRTELTRDVQQLVVAGVSNEHDGSVLAAFDIDRIAGHSPGAPQSRYECVDCSGDVPRSYLLLPRSEGTADLPLQALLSGFDILPNSGIIVRIDHDGPQGRADSIYEISDRFTLLRASFSDAHWQRHRQLEIAGAIGHDARACPEREGPAAFASAAGGWTRLKPETDAATQPSNSRN